MAFGNTQNDYPGAAEKGFGAGKTADQSPFSVLCPTCRKNSVKETKGGENEYNEYFSEVLICGNCGWQSDAKPI